MSLKNITLVIEPPQQDPYDPMHRSNEFEYDRFAKELQKYSRARVNIVESSLSEAPDRGFILLYTWNLTESLNGCQPEIRYNLQQRIVLMNSLESNSFDLLDRLNRLDLAAAIGYVVYAFWQAGGEPPDLMGLMGLTSVAKKICTDYLYETERYCVMKDNPFNSLPALLIRYLEAYHRTIIDSSDTPDLDYLLFAFNREDQDVRREIVLKLSNVPDERALNILLSSLYDGDWVIRTRAARGLTHYAHSFDLKIDLQPILTQIIIQDSHSDVRINAVRWLVEYANGINLDARITLHKLIGQHSDELIRRFAFIQLLQHIDALHLMRDQDLHQVIDETPDEITKKLATHYLTEAET